MMSRTQVSFEAEMHRKAKDRATQLGMSLAEYLRRLVERDLWEPKAEADASKIFNLADSGASDIARNKDEYVGAAVSQSRPTSKRTRDK